MTKAQLFSWIVENSVEIRQHRSANGKILSASVTFRKASNMNRTVCVSGENALVRAIQLAQEEMDADNEQRVFQ